MFKQKTTICAIGLCLLCVVALESLSQTAGSDVKFKKYHLWDEFYTEAATVADVNRDGKMDIIAGARWFEAPGWKAHDIWKHKKFDYTKGYSDSFLNFAIDVNEDGWTDLICFDFPGKEVYWFENPKSADVLWKRYLIDSVASNESPMAVDINNDGKTDLVFGNEKLAQMAWFSAVVKNNKVSWQRHPISETNASGVGMFSHGLGWGDINGDGIKDVMIRGGWWEAPKDMKTSPWTFHEANLGESCAQMITYDFDGDGDNDVLTSSAHDYGVWWHEQIRDDQGRIAFKTHAIDTTFSEAHSIVLQDVNGDGLPDFITGKRFFSHQGKGPGGQEPAVLYWFELLKDGNNRPVWKRHLIDDNSGVGIQFVTEDMNKDGRPDIVIGNKNGVYYFEQE
ncbi:VCBS repeat-containing protein [Agriterribacter sp.]|uniref:FG-GAP repeat domain-containing protein n=1 Tax=Agriterribacter sp. TaxID=2821509 RepID=UPI002B95835D|nr:VCBS repeat-containing protein [Agriterribacter sp.]HRP56607.1 VCBS repeat-containing protein [Agriterribacter sp.]